ncbi:MAG: SAM-dependent methyltransferase [Polyangiaceae bacterium]|nr:SAM-dependent methyltransferase [Polyangiaceae bacterium]
MADVADTAFSIAVVRAEEAERPVSERLFSDPYAHHFAAAGAHAAEATQRYLDLPFFRDGVRLRTRYIDDAVRDGLASGLTQLVLLGAGFDARGLRMPEVIDSGVKVFEVDVPTQLERKGAILEAAGIPLPEHITYVPFDFAEGDIEAPLTEALAAKGFRKGAGAMFVWEGVIGYITSEMIDASLAFMAHSGGPTTRLVFTFGAFVFDPVSAIDRVQKAGFTRFQEDDFISIWKRYLPAEPPEVARYSRMGIAIV